MKLSVFLAVPLLLFQLSKLTQGNEAPRNLSEDQECPGDFFPVEKGGKLVGCYKSFSDKKRRWKDAKKKCESEGLRLAQPQNAILVRSHLVNNTGLDYPSWIGASLQGDSFKWLSGEELSYENCNWLYFNFEQKKRKCLILMTRPGWMNVYPDKPFYNGGCNNAKLLTLCEKVLDCNPKCQNGATCNSALECECQPGWTGEACDIKDIECSEGFFKSSGKCYKFIDEWYDWEGANDLCRGLGLFLPEPSDPLKLREDLWQYKKKAGWVWLGARGNGVGFTWTDCGEELPLDSPLLHPQTRKPKHASSDYCLQTRAECSQIQKFYNEPLYSLKCDNGETKVLCESRDNAKLY